MISVSSAMTWLGNKATDLVFGEIDQRLRQAGEAWLAQSRALAPVDTGRLRAEEGYRIDGRTLVLVMGAPYDIFQEFGTRTIRPHPHVRPAMDAIGRVFGSSLTMEFNAPGAGVWQGIYAHQGGFAVPSRIQPRPLTRAQHEHVRKHLMPVSKRLHKGNVKRAKMVVRRFD